MAKIKIIAGDWNGPAQYFSYGKGTIDMLLKDHVWKKETRELAGAELIEASEENVKSLVGAGAFGAAGALLLGPVGLLAGILLGGNKKVKAGILTWDDGKRILFECDAKTYTKMIGNTMMPA